MKENVEKFSGMASIYEKYRPNYDDEFFKEIFSSINLTTDKVVVDLGAGTGKFSQVLVNLGYNPILIEPNNEMCEILKEKFSNNKILSTTAEKTELEDNSVDCICVAQSFHWFDTFEFKKEALRILKNDGFIILIWNMRNDHGEMEQELIRISKKYCSRFKGFSGGFRDEMDKLEYFFNNNYVTKFKTTNVLYSLEEFIGRVRSSSYCLRENERYYKDFMKELEQMFNLFQENNKLHMPYVTECYIGKIKE